MLISWITARVQRAHEKRLAGYEREMKLRQRVMKAAGLGLYGNFDSLVAEAKRRVAEKNRTSKEST